MSTKEYWIQLENHKWDMSPSNIDRMDGQTIVQKTGIASQNLMLSSPVTGTTRTKTMFNPVGGASAVDVLIFRRYTENWAAPVDRKVNPWDYNEPDPTDNGTMGTIPGAVIECNVGDKVIVHFRNMDSRSGKPIEHLTHSMHTHGFVFEDKFDGAYPLSPVDTNQPVGGEAALWSAIGVSGFKKGDRVPSGGTFTYTWETFGWPTTAGVWLYHDHSICDMDNVKLGAIGIVVIHNTDDNDDVQIGDPLDDVANTADLPGGSWIGKPYVCLPFILDKAIPLANRLPDHLINTGLMQNAHLESHHMTKDLQKGEKRKSDNLETDPIHEVLRKDKDLIALNLFDDLDLIINIKDLVIKFFGFCHFRTPPSNGQYLLLFHELNGVQCINGRQYLGNTPTLIAGLNTKMRFGVVGMGQFNGFHTFHIHGHRWVLKGPAGNTDAAIQGSVQNIAVSQFEDTRTFGPANSFAFNLNPGTFMRSAFPTNGLGEFHMHCHVLDHMMMGMMGSLKLVNGGETTLLAFPRGVPCPEDGGGIVTPLTITVNNFMFMPANLMVSNGDTVNFNFVEAGHTVKTVSTTGTASPVTINNGAGDLDAIPAGTVRPVTITGTSGSVINYQCGIHGVAMPGTITIM